MENCSLTPVTDRESNISHYFVALSAMPEPHVFQRQFETNQSMGKRPDTTSRLMLEIITGFSKDYSLRDYISLTSSIVLMNCQTNHYSHGNYNKEPLGV